MCEERMYLLPKNNDTKGPKNHRPIICLSRAYKLLTSALTDRIHLHLEQSDPFPLDQKGRRRGLYGCKDQLIINKIILETARKAFEKLRKYKYLEIETA